MNIQDSRILIKRSTTAGEIPTVPASDDHTDGSWISTDIYKGEIFINQADGRIYTRDDTGILDLTKRPATSYSSSRPYKVGDMMTTGGLWYLCHTNTSGSFDSSKWTIIGINTSAFAVGWSGGVPAPTQAAVYDIVVSAPVSKTSDYTFVITDLNKSFEFDKATAIVATIPTNASVAFGIGTIIYLAQTNAGQLEVVPDTGVTLVSADSYTKLRAQDSCAYIQKIGTNTWRLVGDLAA